MGIERLEELKKERETAERLYNEISSDYNNWYPKAKQKAMVQEEAMSILARKMEKLDLEIEEEAEWWQKQE